LSILQVQAGHKTFGQNFNSRRLLQRFGIVSGTGARLFAHQWVPKVVLSGVEVRLFAHQWVPKVAVSGMEYDSWSDRHGLFQRLLYREWSTAFCPPVGFKGCSIRNGGTAFAHQWVSKVFVSGIVEVRLFAHQWVSKVAVSGMEYDSWSDRHGLFLRLFYREWRYGFLPDRSRTENTATGCAYSASFIL
jgi:hypothetical protein